MRPQVVENKGLKWHFLCQRSIVFMSKVNSLMSKVNSCLCQRSIVRRRFMPKVNSCLCQRSIVGLFFWKISLILVNCGPYCGGHNILWFRARKKASKYRFLAWFLCQRSIVFMSKVNDDLCQRSIMIYVKGQWPVTSKNNILWSATSWVTIHYGGGFFVKGQ